MNYTVWRDRFILGDRCSGPSNKHNAPENFKNPVRAGFSNFDDDSGKNPPRFDRGVRLTDS
jgi:hypothetical protein